MVYNYSLRYETDGVYNTGGGGGTADYVFMLCFGMCSILLSHFFLSSHVPPLFTSTLVYFVMYVWSRREPHSQTNIYGFPVKRMYLPYVFIAINVVMGGSPASLLHGMGVGHLYYFLIEVVPREYGKDYLHTPDFLINHFGVGVYVPPVAPPRQQGFGNNTFGGRMAEPERPTRAARGGGYNWGVGGQSLGSN